MNIFIVVTALMFGGGINAGYSQNSKKVSVYLEEYKYTFTPQSENCMDTIISRMDDGISLKIYLSGCMGSMHLECYKKNKKIEEGDYVNSLDLLKKYIKSVNAITGKLIIHVKEYYQPLRSGEWIFYGDKGQILYKKKYLNGVLQKDTVSNKPRD